jgi:hypothetical protein
VTNPKPNLKIALSKKTDVSMEEWDDVHFLIPETAEHVGCSPELPPRDGVGAQRVFENQLD